MFHFEPGPNRWKLGFREAVLKNFRFLWRYGFRCVRAEPTIVRYEKIWPIWRRKVFVQVFHGRGSYVMGVDIGRVGEGEVTFSLDGIVAWAGGPEAEEFEKRTMFQTNTPEGVQEFVPKMAELVRKYARPFLGGDKEAYERAAQQNAREALLYQKQLHLEQMRERAEIAWHARDYAQILVLYEPFQEDLTRAEGMRLEYAKKRLVHTPQQAKRS